MRFNQKPSARTLKQYRQHVARASFTVVETVIALGILAFLIIEVSAVQGNSIVFSDYSRNVTQGTWLAKRVMSQVEYYWKTKPFKELETNAAKEVPFKEFQDDEEGGGDGYKYTLEIKEWKFPFEQLLMGGFSAGDEEESAEEENPMAGVIDQVIKQVFGDEPQFMTAHVEVCWSEGAAQNCTALTNLLTNQAKLDEAIVALKPVYDKLQKADEGGKDDPKPPKPGPGDPPPNPPGGDR